MKNYEKLKDKEMVCEIKQGSGSQ